MNYFKVIKNSQVVDIGSVFMVWNTTYRQLFDSPIEKAQFVQTLVNRYLFHDEWMKNVPEHSCEYQEARVILIQKQEYDELKALLEDGEEIKFDREEAVPIPEEHEYEPEAAMSISEMRTVIENQRAQIAILTDCILEMSEVLYGEET